MSETTLKLTPPPFPLAFLEAGRAIGEMSSLPMAQFALRGAPVGDGHPVVVCPGFLTSDSATSFLRRFIRSKGYSVYGWNLGRNLGPETAGLNSERLADWVENVYRQHNRRVSLVGWSLGGVMARELAKRMPDMVRQVITLGSPLRGDPDSTSISLIFKMISTTKLDAPEMQEILSLLRHPPEETPSTAIFTKTDGIVPWRGCIEPEAEMTDNVEVYASNCGLGVNPFVFFAIADRLALPETHWTRFDREASAWRRVAFPSSGHVYGYSL